MTNSPRKTSHPTYRWWKVGVVPATVGLGTAATGLLAGSAALAAGLLEPAGALGGIPAGLGAAGFLIGAHLPDPIVAGLADVILARSGRAVQNLANFLMDPGHRGPKVRSVSGEEPKIDLR